MYQEGGKKGCEAAQEVTDEWKGLSPAERFAVEFFRQPKGKIVLCKEIDGAELQIEIKGGTGRARHSDSNSGLSGEKTSDAVSACHEGQYQVLTYHCF